MKTLSIIVTSHGLSCEVCKCKVHKRCAAKAIANCKWTTLATVGREIIEDVDGVSIKMKKKRTIFELILTQNPKFP